MSDEVSFQRLLREQPDDAATWLVYADWLEGQGETQRARVVREHRKLVEMTGDQARLTFARKLLTLAKGLPRGWLLALAKQRLANTCWGARDANGGVYLVVFGKRGTLHFKQGDAGEENLDEEPTEGGDGTWMQIGDAVTFSINDYQNARHDFSRQDGVLIRDDALLGVGSNADKETWKWGLARLERAVFDDALPDLPDIPGDSTAKKAKAAAMLPRRRW